MDALGRAERAHSAFRPMVGSCVEFMEDLVPEEGFFWLWIPLFISRRFN